MHWGLYAPTITDKNGNQIKLNSNGKGYTDTLGRALLSWTGLGNNNDAITISGLNGNIVLHWGTTPATLQLTGQNLGPQTCNAPTAGPVSIPVVTDIDLPNGQTYSFQYDSTYGRLSRITFPGNGYVRYVWGSNPLSAVTSQSWWYGTVSSSCTFRYGTPAITDRYVSYDGSTEVLHQHFSYVTTWGTSNWNSKKTTVNTTDLLTSQSTVTVYNYGWVQPDAAVMTNPSAMGQQVPVETSVVYQDGSSHTLKSVNKTWKNLAALLAEQTTLDGDTNHGTTTLRCYDANEQVTNLFEYGFPANGSSTLPTGTLSNGSSCAPAPSPASPGGPITGVGPLARQTVSAFHNFVGTSPSTHIVNEPDSVIVSDGSGNTARKTTFGYDANAIQPSGAATGLITPTTQRGNVTSIARSINASSSATTGYVWYDTGTNCSK